MDFDLKRPAAVALLISGLTCATFRGSNTSPTVYNETWRLLTEAGQRNTEELLWWQINPELNRARPLYDK